MANMHKMSLFHALLVVLSFVNIGLGQTTTTSRCVTRYTAKSVVPSSTGITKTVSSTFRQTVTTTRTSTITPKPVTSTTTSTSTAVTTTTIQSTSTVTITSVTYTGTTGTETDTTTTTQTVESTTTPPASTVPTAAGFTPLASASGFVARRSPEFARKIQARAPASSSKVKLVASNGAVAFAPKVYPKATTCTTVVRATTTITKTSTAPGVVRTTASPSTSTVTSTVTTTSTSTSVLNPTYSLVIVVSTSTTTDVVSTTTTTATATSTVYVEAPTPTAYAQCASNNEISTSNGGMPIQGISVDGGNVDYMAVGGGLPDANSCCEQCAMTATCVGFYYYASANECYYFVTTDGTCAGNQPLLSYTTSSNDYGITIGDGACGYYADNGNY